MYRLSVLVLLASWFVANTASRAADIEPPKKGPAEIRELLKLSPDEFIKRFDRNKDGMLSKDELPPFLARAFDRFDSNRDGKLDKKEVEQMLQSLRRMVANSGNPGGPRLGPAGEGPDFDALDRNADGRLTRDELKGTPYFDKFDEIDTNKDGKIDRKEFAAWLKKQAEKRAP
jgi:Ca2+-binding EF-hand superfamily protein